MLKFTFVCVEADERRLLEVQWDGDLGGVSVEFPGGFRVVAKPGSDK